MQAMASALPVQPVVTTSGRTAAAAFSFGKIQQSFKNHFATTRQLVAAAVITFILLSGAGVGLHFVDQNTVNQKLAAVKSGILHDVALSIPTSNTGTTHQLEQELHHHQVVLQTAVQRSCISRQAGSHKVHKVRLVRMVLQVCKAHLVQTAERALVTITTITKNSGGGGGGGGTTTVPQDLSINSLTVATTSALNSVTLRPLPTVRSFWCFLRYRRSS